MTELKINLEISGTPFVLSIAEAQALFDQLNRVFGYGLNKMISNYKNALDDGDDDDDDGNGALGLLN
jgi:hypothetical protein